MQQKNNTKPKNEQTGKQKHKTTYKKSKNKQKKKRQTATNKLKQQ